jgi:hypothetical protein
MSVLVAHRSVAHPIIPPCMSLMAASTMSAGHLAVVTTGSPRSVLALVPRMLGASGASRGATGVKVIGVSPWLGDDAGSLLQDLVMCGTSAGVPRSAALDDAAPTPGSLVAVGLGVSGLHLSGSPGFLLPPIN